MTNPKTPQTKRKTRFCQILLILSVATLIPALFLSFSFLILKNKISTQTKDQITLEIKNAAEKIDTELQQTMNIANNLALKLDKESDLTKKTLEKEILETLKKHSHVFGIGIAFAPFAFTTSTRLYSPYAMRSKKNEIELKLIEQEYDYTIPSSKPKGPKMTWFLYPIKKGAMWSEPYFGKTSNRIVLEYAIPFYRPKDKEKKHPIGIVFINYDLNRINNLVTSLNLRQAGYGFILSPKGIFINHPLEKLSSNLKSIFELAEKINDSSLKSVAKDMLNEKNGKNGTIDWYDHLHKKSCWLTYHKIPTTNWVIASIDFKDEIFGMNAKQFRRDKILISLNFLIFFILLSFSIACLFRKDLKILWYCSIAISIFLAVEIGIIWKLAFTQSLRENVKSEIIVGTTDLNNFVKPYTKNHEQINIIPTGLLIRHIEFEDVNHITIVGYIWQKFNKNISNKIEKGIFFPNSTSVEEKIVYTKQEGEDLIVGWDFKCILYQHTIFNKYPFDYKNITLQINPKDLNNKTILIPDFPSYNLITPKSLPGIQPSLMLKGWNIEQSFFSYQTSNLDTELGLKEVSPKQPVQLIFNVLIKRKILKPFISRIMPLIVALLLLFITLVVASKKYFYTNLSILAALFFSLILAQISLRNYLTSEEFFYLEYFYYIAYGVMSAVIINLTLHLKTKIPALQERDNLLPKLLYCPLILAILLILTVKTFF